MAIRNPSVSITKSSNIMSHLSSSNHHHPPTELQAFKADGLRHVCLKVWTSPWWFFQSLTINPTTTNHIQSPQWPLWGRPGNGRSEKPFAIKTSNDLRIWVNKPINFGEHHIRHPGFILKKNGMFQATLRRLFECNFTSWNPEVPKIHGISLSDCLDDSGETLSQMLWQASESKVFRSGDFFTMTRLNVKSYSNGLV